MENKNKTSVKDLMQKLGTLMALAILFLIFCLVLPGKFPKVGNLMNILKQASINCLIASGMLCALITAGIDLSVGSNCVLCTCTIGVLVEAGITNPLLLILALFTATFFIYRDFGIRMLLGFGVLCLILGADLVKRLMELPDITFCPHGRPVAMEMKKRNIDHQFERC